MPRTPKFAVIVRRSLNDEANIEFSGTKKDGLAYLAEVADAPGTYYAAALCHLIAGEQPGEVIEMIESEVTVSEGESEKVSVADIAAILDAPSADAAQDVADAVVSRVMSDQEAAGMGQADPSIATPVKKAPVVVNALAVGDKVRYTPKGGKFSPIVLATGVCSVDGVECLVGHDVEYDKERVTVIDTIEVAAVKAKRYVDFDLALFDTLPRLDDRVTAVKEEEVTEA